MRILRGAALTLVMATGAACYHATIETGLAPSAQTIEKPFASAWIYGLVPPSTVETASKCPNGVAKVETQLSFVNMLVGFITLSIYTPMDIKVTCAAGRGAAVPGSTVNVGADADSTAVRQAVESAVQQSAETHHEMYVVFQH